LTKTKILLELLVFKLCRVGFLLTLIEIIFLFKLLEIDVDRNDFLFKLL